MPKVLKKIYTKNLFLTISPEMHAWFKTEAKRRGASLCKTADDLFREAKRLRDETPKAGAKVVGFGL